ncbi:hypothetical protein QBC34DRAFT_76847 [Podospora aff. communis PSN243]|uniref:WD-like domain-containing protein n=1 Tax=Podospora aff. communis PSN243 TaxID=3040156 RepID=A0AAV9GRE2_9PEZI|nr:hypothetical protein QBC34DRAFT_76847 [Podospora aff. communis PSN243]
MQLPKLAALACLLAPALVANASPVADEASSRLTRSIVTPYGVLDFHAVDNDFLDWPGDDEEHRAAVQALVPRQDFNGTDGRIKNQYSSEHTPYSACPVWALQCRHEYRRTVPPINVCDALFRGLTGALDLPLASNERSVCLGGGGLGRCCISWSKKIDEGLQARHLLEAAEYVRSACVLSQGKAGFVQNVDFGKCVTVCLSSKPGNCHWLTGVSWSRLWPW